MTAPEANQLLKFLDEQEAAERRDWLACRLLRIAVRNMARLARRVCN